MTGILAGRRILVVEDEMLVLRNIEMALADVGCSAVSAAASVMEALSLLTQHSFDAAVIDINLGGDKSYPIADKLAEQNIPFAFSTGYGDHGARSDFNHRPVLKKPYLAADLVAVFEKLMADTPLPRVV